MKRRVTKQKFNLKKLYYDDLAIKKKNGCLKELIEISIFYLIKNLIYFKKINQ
jgi:hypothetical protein